VRPSDFAACLVTQFAHRGRIGFRAVGDDRLGLAVALQRFAHEPQSCRFIAGFGDVAFQHLTLVIYSAPEVVRLAVDLYVDLIEVPPPVAESPHAADQPLADVGGEHRAEPVPPQMNSLVANVYPRSNSRSSTLRNESGKRTYILTTRRITSGEEWK
jgi:hypothetical protein